MNFLELLTLLDTNNLFTNAPKKFTRSDNTNSTTVIENSTTVVELTKQKLHRQFECFDQQEKDIMNFLELSTLLDTHDFPATATIKFTQSDNTNSRTVIEKSTTVVELLKHKIKDSC
ncbi:hypothetical protein EL45_10110 [Cellulophaga sp. E6(2014)]|nr:hypothetical protein EL45_10110 [Cellulophaga sp. E6(2014)]